MRLLRTEGHEATDVRLLFGVTTASLKRGRAVRRGEEPQLDWPKPAEITAAPTPGNAETPVKQGFRVASSGGGGTRRDGDSQLENAQSAQTRSTFRSSSGVEQAGQGGLDDPGVSRLIDLWPSLPEDVRRQILALAEAAGETSAL